MTIFWSRHSLEKVKDRNLSKEVIRLTVTNPDVLVSGREGRFEAYKKMRTKFLKVVYINRKNHQVIVTAHYIDRVRKS